MRRPRRAGFKLRAVDTPVLYLIPVGLSDAPLSSVLPPENALIASSLRHFIVENERTARRFLKRLDPGIDINALTMTVLNVDTPAAAVPAMLEPMERGESVGVMSEAGCPGVADPGALAVAVAQQRGYKVVPLVGPSSILMGLMASGFSGQRFAFHGYLPIEAEARAAAIRAMERESAKKGMTQIFIETPYRNDQCLDTLARTLRPATKICVASAITDPERESIRTLTAAQWRTAPHRYHKIPTIFLIYAQ